MKGVCSNCSVCEDRGQVQGGDLDLVSVHLGDESLAGGAAGTGPVLKGRELKLSPGHFGLENWCDGRSNHSLPAVPEYWAATVDVQRPGQHQMESALPAAGESIWGLEEYKDATVAMTPPPKEEGWCVPGGRMDDEQMLEKLWWCLFCCCMGFGVAKSRAPLGVTFNCCCANTSWQTTSRSDADGNCCGTFTELCCFECLCRAPPRAGDPRCIWCGFDFCGLVGSVAREGRPTKPHDLSRLSDIDAEVALPFIPCWCCCAGLRLMPPSNCVDNYMRCLWCEYSFSTGMPDTEAGLCLHLVNCWCCYSLCKFPPTSRHNPLCACCGRVCIDRDHAKT